MVVSGSHLLGSALGHSFHCEIPVVSFNQLRRPRVAIFLSMRLSTTHKTLAGPVALAAAALIMVGCTSDEGTDIPAGGEATVVPSASTSAGEQTAAAETAAAAATVAEKINCTGLTPAQTAEIFVEARYECDFQGTTISIYTFDSAENEQEWITSATSIAGPSKVIAAGDQVVVLTDDKALGDQVRTLLG